MKLQFDSQQDFQLSAIQSIVDVFEGQPLRQGDFEISFDIEGASIALTEKGLGNRLVISEDQILHNIRTVQERNGIIPSEQLERCYYLKEDNKTKPDFIPLNLTVEMETGTGKSYTYLRTIFELNRVYGFKKFVIVVPSVAIREGALKNLQITEEHFRGLYGNPPFSFLMYDSGKLAALRNFALSNAIQVLVINIDSFTKDSNIINTVRETGVKPIEYIQATNPIVIVDEPQNMETDGRKAAIHNLNPLFTLRYSATHRNLYNLVYSLNPVQAYDLGLVKQIEVDGIVSDDNHNAAFIQLKKIQIGKKNLKARLSLYANQKNGVGQEEFWVDIGMDLFLLSGGRDVYQDGYILNAIRADKGEVEFSNGQVLALNESQGGLSEDVIRYMMERTIYWHFEKEVRYWKSGLQYDKIKVLTLFFIDKVSNYREYDPEGKPVKGKYAIWFEEIFDKYVRTYRGKYPDIFTPPPPENYLNAQNVHESDIPTLNPEYWNAEKAHNGYFSQDRGRVKDTNGSTKLDADTYTLIMKDKERLLSFDEPLRFIFSHSALREGWDNPNVFQICNLNESGSYLKKRQEIGRGLRLPVDRTGVRIHDKRINVLTVIANETYKDFAEALQNEIEEETSVDFSNRIRNAKQKVKVSLTKELTPENCPLFFEIWDRIKQRTRYRVEFSTDELIRRTVNELKDRLKVPPTKRPILEARTARLNYSEEGVGTQLKDIGRKGTQEVKYLIPDVYAYIQSRVDITRKTIFEILKQSDRYGELEVNPQMFLDNVVGAIQRTLNSLLVEGVQYERINGQSYQMSLFRFEEMETYLTDLFQVTDTDKTPFNFIPVDSQIENDFARDCEADPNVKFFFKLPRGFKIPTPVGNYVPDWAVVMGDDNRIYFVAETKGALNRQLLRDIERMKIECGERHFALFKPEGVEYRVAVSARDLT